MMVSFGMTNFDLLSFPHMNPFNTIPHTDARFSLLLR